MTTTAPLDVAAFLAEHHLDPTHGRDPYVSADTAAKAVTYMTDHTPTRYGDAFPAHPDVRKWAADVIAAAIGTSTGRPAVHIGTGPSLLLLGATGVGKTYEAYGAMRLISAAGVHTRWVVISAADLYARLRPRHGVDSETEFRAAADAPLLAVDDLGAAKTSEWVEEVNFRLVNHRYERALPTLFTSNLPPRDVLRKDGSVERPGLRTVLGERVASRLAEMTTRVVIKGTDRRRTA